MLKLAETVQNISKKKLEEMEKFPTILVKTNHEWLVLTGQIIPDTNNFKKKTQFFRSQKSFQPILDHQILIADIYPSWSAPCSAIETHLKRLRLSVIEKPDSIRLARVCCDEIDDLKNFRDDPIPAFLFWSKGRPIALLRGVNRPLMTKLVLQELKIEANCSKDYDHEIHFNSNAVIQCRGDLAQLAQDEFTRSIGFGITEKLSIFFREGLIPIPEDLKAGHQEGSSKERVDTKETGEEEKMDEEIEKPEIETEKVKSNEKDEHQDSLTHFVEEENEEKRNEDDFRKMENSDDLTANSNKIRKKKKRMETGLLKEILGTRIGKRYAY